MQLMKLSETTAARRRVPVYLVDATDGITPETGEAGGQPQISKNGAAFANTSATLTAIGNGGYYVELTAGELSVLGFMMVRYKSANTVEFNWVVQVVDIDPYDALRAGLSALPNAAADAAGGLPISDAGGLDLDAILADTADMQPKLGTPAGASISADIAAVQADTDNLQTRVPAALVGGRMDSSVGAMATGVVDAAALAADAAQEIADEILTTRRGTAQAGAGSSITLDAGASATNDLYNGQAVRIISGTGAGQVRQITDYDGTTKVATVERAWAVAPDATSVFRVFALAPLAPPNWASLGIEADGHAHADLKEWLGVAPLALVAQRVASQVGAMATDVMTAAAMASDMGNEIADLLLGRSIQGGASGGRTVTDALRALRNKVAIAGGTMTVYQENDASAAWTAAVTTAAGDPITEVDPA